MFTLPPLYSKGLLVLTRRAVCAVYDYKNVRRALLQFQEYGVNCLRNAHFKTFALAIRQADHLKEKTIRVR